ncbi:trypsin-like peptidase domain-containing protein [Candidatus Bipolaricaulota bacterium]|nr:trypsin-like peptidase domain-containing protein [Candidatus Bipolaricaulota bacterium]MBS3825003.1 trypsin-like peptidase domain-containing protein [Candidatus Bipolaricaulota bacterium]
MISRSKSFSVILALVIGIGLISAGLVPALGSEGSLVESQETAITRSAEKVGPAVVRVEVTKGVSAGIPFNFFEDPFFKYFFGEPPQREEREVKSLGSGFVIDWQGKKYVLTNEHVVSGAKEIRLVFKEGMTYQAKVAGADEMIDVAVLEITGDKDTENLPVASLGDPANTPIGSWVVAIGNPEGFENTVTAGVLSARNRSIPKPNDSGSYQNLLQTDAAINPGNSGGPLVNMQGKVIGMNTAIIRRNQQGIPITGLNFAVSIDSVERVLADLVSKGEVTRAWLGVGFQKVTPEMGEKFGLEDGHGVLISEVYPDSPADRGGLKSGDIIIKVNDNKITGATEFQQEIMYRDVGEEVELTLIRNQERKTITVELGKRDNGQIETSEEKSSITDDDFGLTLVENTPKIRQEYELSVATGLVITDLQGFARARGLREGDVLLQAGKNSRNLYTLQSVGDWKKIAADTSKGDTLLVRVVRGDSYIWMTLAR